MSPTPPEHEHSAAIDEAVVWLRDTPRHMRSGPIIKQLQQRFGLNTTEACAALHEYNLILTRVS